MSLAAVSVTPRVILGLMTFGPDESAGARITDLGEYNTILDIFQTKGYSEVDTARSYVGGKQEAFTKEAQWQKRGLSLATKVWPVAPGAHSGEKLTETFEKSLKELGADCVDILYLHSPDRSLPFAETLEALDGLHKKGKFVKLGLSNYTAFEVAEIVMTCKYNNWVRPTIYQAMYNAIARAIDDELIPACHHYGIDVVIYNPLAGGLFSGKIKSKDIVPDEGRFGSKNAAIGNNYRERYFRDGVFTALQIVEKAVQKADLTMIEVALRWCVHHSKLTVGGVAKKGNDGIIIGVSSRKQLEENLAACEKGPLPQEVVDALDEAWKATKGDTPSYWRGEMKYGYDGQQVFFGQ